MVRLPRPAPFRKQLLAQDLTERKQREGNVCFYNVFVMFLLCVFWGGGGVKAGKGGGGGRMWTRIERDCRTHTHAHTTLSNRATEKKTEILSSKGEKKMQS